MDVVQQRVLGVNDPGQFALNVAAWFHGERDRRQVPGLFIRLRTHRVVSPRYHDRRWTHLDRPVWTVPMTFPFDLPTLLEYDGVFLAGNAADNQVLIDYVNHGGNVYLAGGTGLGSQNAEALRWNTFLNAFGLAFSTFDNFDVGSIPISSTHPIFAGVDHLYQNNGNDTLVVSTNDPRTQVLVYDAGCALYAVYDSVPEPTILPLLIISLVGLIDMRRRRAG